MNDTTIPLECGGPVKNRGIQPTVTIEETLRAGFSEAHQRVSAIVLDVLWKAIWIIFTDMLFLLGMIWLRVELGSITLRGPASALRNPLALLSLARELWRIYAATLFAGIIAFASVSVLAWLFLEAYFRAGTLPVSSEGFSRTASRNFKVFLGSSLLKIVLIGGVSGIFGVIVFGRYLSAPFAEWPTLWLDTRGPFLVVCLACIALWFLLTLLETLVRSGSMELFGREFFLVVGVMATLLAFEGTIFASAVVALISLMAVVSGPAGVLLVLIAAVVFAAILSVLHSYLLVVRFSALESAAQQLPQGFHPAGAPLRSR